VDSEDLSEEGFDCHAAPEVHADATSRAAFLVGTPTSPINAKYRALVRLHYIHGMDKESCPAIGCCGGRVGFHGAPMASTWRTLSMNAVQGADRVFINGSLDG